MNLSRIILKNLQTNEEYARKTLPFLKSDYFSESAEKIIFNEINSFISDYSNLPTYEALVIQLEEKPLAEAEYNSSIEILNDIHQTESEKVDLEWLVDKTETFCQEKAVYNAVLESITILDGKHKELSKGAIPKLLQDALGVSFNTSIGHDYLGDSESRYDYYHRKEERVKFHLDYFNKITNDGLPKKTLNIILAQPHGGKSLMMCDFAANFQMSGNNVLYITCEMAEEEIAKRVDANLLKVTMDDLILMDKSSYDKKIKYIKSKTVGKMFIKEYPTASANVNHFRALLNELRLKKNFVPDVVFVDYMNICASARVKMSGSVNSYTYIKAIGEELRGLAQEFNVPVVTATQTTRCLALDTKINCVDGEKNISDLVVGDIIESHSGFVSVDHIYPINKVKTYKIKTKSGKEIICSGNHIFPTSQGEKTVFSGLSVGDKLFVK